MIRAFLMGVMEFRSFITKHYDDLNMRDAYDLGRETAHKLTFHVFEEA